MKSIILALTLTIATSASYADVKSLNEIGCDEVRTKLVALDNSVGFLRIMAQQKRAKQNDQVNSDSTKIDQVASELSSIYVQLLKTRLECVKDGLPKN